MNKNIINGLINNLQLKCKKNVYNFSTRSKPIKIICICFVEIIFKQLYTHIKSIF